MRNSNTKQGLTLLGTLLHTKDENRAYPESSKLTQNARKNVPDGTAAKVENGSLPANDILGDPRFPDFFNCDTYDMQVFHSQGQKDTPSNYSERFAYFLAEGLDDLENVALYKSYCQKYPVGIVLDAFQRAKETPTEKIKTSRGALFNYLTKIYAQKTNRKDSGNQARS